MAKKEPAQKPILNRTGNDQIYLDTPRNPVNRDRPKVTVPPLPGARVPYDLRLAGSGTQTGAVDVATPDQQPPSPAGSASPDTIPPTPMRGR
jgi:hypothetical protein